MTNSKREYNEFIRANLPYGIEYDSARYQYVTFNGKRFVTYLEAKWYIDYLTKFGGGPEDDIRNDLFGTSEEGVWFEANDSTTLFTDVVGTTPVTAPGDAVALQLDKSQGLTLGPELVTNGTFDTDSDWTKGTGWTISGGAANANVTGFQSILQAVGAVVGKTYSITFTVSFVSGALGVGIGSSGQNATSPVITSGTYTRLISVASGTSNGNLYFRGNESGTGNFVGTIDNISVKELPGNHRTQATTAARPLYALHPVGGVRNELVSTNTLATQNVTVTAAERTLSFKGTGTVTLSGASTAGPLAGTGAEDIVSLTFTPTAGTLTLTVSGTVEEAQLELGATRTNYQTVGSTFLDVSEEGKARRGRLWYNGTSHFMKTGTITPGTDKAQIFAGVRNLNIAANSVIVENSTNSFSLDGTLQISTDTNGRYVVSSKGTVFRSAQTSSGLPINTSVVANLSDISGDTTILRVDSLQEAQSTGDQGTGNYLAYPLYFGARAGISLFFNGYEDTSIVRFGPNLDDTTISKVESYVASKTPEETI